jgi:cysteine desulfurase
VEPEEIVFTSGATESNGAILLSALDRPARLGGRGGKLKIITTQMEHSSVFEQVLLLQGRGLSCVFVKPARNGMVDPSEIEALLDGDTVLVSIMLVNNETGAIQEIADIAAVVRGYSERKGRKVVFHTDAAQGFGKVPFSPRSMGIDAVSVSGHKIGGPRGVGALFLAKGVQPGFLAAGGEQEAGRRPGTENLPGICGMVRAAELRFSDLARDLENAQGRTRRLIQGLLEIPGARIFPDSRIAGETARFSPYIISAGFPPIPGEVVVRVADGRGILLSTGSACSSRKKNRTRILESMGISRETALCAIRVSFGAATTDEEIFALVRALQEEIPPLMDMSRGRAR